VKGNADLSSGNPRALNNCTEFTLLLLCKRNNKTLLFIMQYKISEAMMVTPAQNKKDSFPQMTAH
jgi:hypothetical protein